MTISEDPRQLLQLRRPRSWPARDPSRAQPLGLLHRRPDLRELGDLSCHGDEEPGEFQADSVAFSANWRTSCVRSRTWLFETEEFDLPDLKLGVDQVRSVTGTVEAA